MHEPEHEHEPELVDLPPPPGGHMADKSGWTAHRAHSDEFLHERPVELLARLARATRLCAITDALLFPDHPALRARWSSKLERYVGHTGRPVDCVAVRDGRVLHLHRGGEAEPTSVVALRKADDLVSLLFALEELERFRALSSVQVAANDLELLHARISDLARAIEVRPVVAPTAVPPLVDEQPGPVESSTQSDPRAGAPPDEELSSASSPSVAPLSVLPSGVPLTLQQRVERGLAELVHRKDVGSLVWLSLAGVVSFGTTWHGATALGLRAELALVGTTFVCGFLWTLLAGLAMDHDKVRKHTAEAVFAAICVYCGFFTYYEGMTAREHAAQSTERAASAHVALVGAVYEQHKGSLEALRKEAAAITKLKDAEIADGSSGSGVKGYGPAAKALALELGEVEREAARVEGQLAPLEAVVHTPIEGLTPDEVLLLAGRIWSAAPEAWRTSSAPERGSYVDLDVPSSPILLPVHAVQGGEPEAYVALVAAAAVEGMMIWCGLAIERRKRERVIKRATLAATRLHREVVDAVASARASRALPGRARYLHVDDE